MPLLRLSARLRDHTRDEHVALERALAIGGPCPTPRDVLGFLAVNLAVQRALERRLATMTEVALPATLELPRRARARLLERDVAALGRDPARVRDADLSFVDTMPAAIGALYVVEGSTLGGAVLRKHLATKLGEPFATSLGSLFPYGEGTRRMWTAFCDVADACPAQDHDAACVAASATFRAFRHLVDASSVRIESPAAAR